MKKPIFPKNGPKAIGPYSPGIFAGVDTIYISGQLGIDSQNNELVEGVENQCHQALNNMKILLEEANFNLKDLVKVTIFVKDMNDFSKINEIYSSYLTEPYPARSVIEVNNLPKGGLVEIEGIAHKCNGIILNQEKKL